ncbi:MAG: hypothetical protein KF712_13675 [Akkermansiaceae bacterium]|nr:hypothetical protein [Akkermansiaceae bacterium]
MNFRRRRRRKKGESESNLDALLDVLTNVVVVLIVVLLLLQIDVEKSVQRIFDNLMPATPEQVEFAKHRLNDLDEQITKQQELLDAPAPTDDQLEQMKADLAFLEKSLADNKAKLIALDELKKLAEKTEKEAEAEKKLTDERLAKIRELEALLDQTPRPQPQAASVVSIPESKPIPNNANLYYCFITGDQAHLIDVIDAQKRVMEVFDRQKREFEVERIRERGERTRYVYQQEEVVRFFETQEIKVRNQTVTVPYNKPWTRLNVRVSFDPARGDASAADMDQPNGRFHRMMELVKSRPRAVLIFKVKPDGFATYLKARQIADGMDIPCGWEVDGNNHVSAPLDIEVNRLEQPPPPPATPLPPVPGRKLD